MSERLLELADGLYAALPADFTPQRDALAKELKKDDAALSSAVKALKKPSVAAWVVNLLVRREAEQVEQVLTVGAALREAQAGMDGAELRALTKQRRQLTAAVTTTARRHAAEAGVKVTTSVADQVEATLTAAMVDPKAAEAVRSGLLVAALAATGVDEVEIAVALPEALGFAASAVVPKEPGRPELHVVPDPDADEKAVAAARAALDEKESARTDAAEALDTATAELGDLEARSMQLQSEIDELKRKLAEVEETLEELDDEISDAEDVKAEAESTLADATSERDAAAKSLQALER